MLALAVFAVMWPAVQPRSENEQWLLFIFSPILWPLWLMSFLAVTATLAFYLIKLIRESAWDAGSPPSRPRFENPYQSLARPLGHLVMLVVICVWPYGLAWAIGMVAPEWWRQVARGVLAITCLLAPMNVLAMALAGKWEDASPAYAWPAVVCLARPYCAFLLVAALLGGIWALAYRLATLAEAERSNLAVLVLGTLGVYLLAVAARALGTLFCVHGVRAGWRR